MITHPKLRNALNEGPRVEPDYLPITSTTGVPISIRPCSLLQGRLAQGFRIGIRRPAHTFQPPSFIAILIPGI